MFAYIKFSLKKYLECIVFLVSWFWFILGMAAIVLNQAVIFGVPYLPCILYFKKKVCVYKNKMHAF